MKLLASFSDVISSEVVCVCNITGNWIVLAGCRSTDLNFSIVVASGKNTKYRDVILCDTCPYSLTVGSVML
jgi:hypothetical protein